MTGKFLGKFHTFKFRDPFLYINNFFDNKNLSNNYLQINKFKEQTPGADFRVWKYSALK